MSCAKTADPIEMQCGMLSRVSPWNMYYMGMQMLPPKRALLRVTGWLKCTVKHRIWGFGRRMSCAKTGEPVLMIYRPTYFLLKKLPFGVAIIAPAVKFLLMLFVKLRLIP